VPEREYQTHNNQVIPTASINNRVYNHGQENQVIPTASIDNRLFNHGQEAVPISENDDNNPLQNYIVQIVKQELQNQRK